MVTLLVGLGIICAITMVLAIIAWISWAACLRPGQHDFLMPDLLDAPPSLVAKATQDRAVALGLEAQAADIVTATLAYKTTATQLMAQGLTFEEANVRLQVTKRGELYSFVAAPDTRVAVEREALLLK